MATQFIVEMREKFNHPILSDEKLRMVHKLIDLVEEYGDALLSVTCGGSEFFRKNGSEVDPKACAEYANRSKREKIELHRRVKHFENLLNEQNADIKRLEELVIACKDKKS